jgi:hypothetical protein
MKNFQNTNKILSSRYGPGFILFFGNIIVLPLALKSSNDLSLFDLYKSFFNSFVSIFILFSLFLLALSIGVINTSKHVKTLSINQKYLVIKLFGVIRSKTIKINYSDILHLEYSSDHFRHFIFTLKNGEKRMMRTDIKEKDEAFKLIQQKIVNSNKNK